MRKLLLCGLLCLTIAVFTSCSRDETATAPENGTSYLQDYAVDPELVAGEIILASGWKYDPEVILPAKMALLDDRAARSHVLDFQREVLTRSVVHYSWLIPVGDGEHDVIRLHRVVQEDEPNRPNRSLHNIFLQHGDAVGFVKFLFGAATPSAPDDHALAIYLAENGVDVWGIDQNWILVPEETTDFGFMENWGFDNQIYNLRTALALARNLRLYTNNEADRMNLLGYSSGGWLGFAYINDEAGRHPSERHVKGFVNADAIYKAGPDNQGSIEMSCDDVAYYAGEMANGVYGFWVGFVEIGELALTDPEGESPIFEGFTNLQTALFFGGATWRMWPVNEWWHYWGAEWDGDPEDEMSMPIDTRFLPIDWALEFMMTASPWEPYHFVHDLSLVTCDEEDVPWDDNLGKITIPILNFGGAGGLAPSAQFTLDLLGSTDVQHVIVSELPPEQKWEDWGHIDIWTAVDAPMMAWQPMLDWIVDTAAREVAMD